MGDEWENAWVGVLLAKRMHVEVFWWDEDVLGISRRLGYFETLRYTRQLQMYSSNKTPQMNSSLISLHPFLQKSYF